MRSIQEILVIGTQIFINDVEHTLNTDFYEVVDNTSVHISLDANETIRLFECAYTIVNGETAQTAEELLTLFGLQIA